MNRTEISFLSPSTSNVFSYPFSQLSFVLLGFSRQRMQVLHQPLCIRSIFSQVTRPMCESFEGSDFLALSSAVRRISLHRMSSCHCDDQSAQYVTSRRLLIFMSFCIARMSSTRSGSLIIGLVWYIFRSPLVNPRNLLKNAIPRPVLGALPCICS